MTQCWLKAFAIGQDWVILKRAVISTVLSSWRRNPIPFIVIRRNQSVAEITLLSTTNRITILNLVFGVRCEITGQIGSADYCPHTAVGGQ